MKMANEWSGKVKNLKDLYTFRIEMKKKVQAYKKIIGRGPDHSLLKNIMYCCMDTASKQHIIDFKLDQQKVDSK